MPPFINLLAHAFYYDITPISICLELVSLRIIIKHICQLSWKGKRRVAILQ